MDAPLWQRGWHWFASSPLRLGTAAAALVLLGFVVWQFTDDAGEMIAERERQPVASFTAGSHSRWQNGFKPVKGDKLMEGQTLKLVEGRAQVSMSCGADLVLRAPCTIVLASPDQVLLREGLLSVQVADWTTGFTVATDSIHIVDLGKQFVVSADAKSGAVEAHAIDGKLRVLATNGPDESRSGLLVSAGEAIRFLPASNTSSRLKANKSLFDPGLDDSRPFKPLPIANTGRGLVPGDEDPHWRIVASTSNEFTSPQYAVVCDTPGKDVYLPNDPDVSQWISTTNPVIENCQPNSAYTFETEFDLTGYDLSTITIVGHVLADNGVIGVRINGQPVPITPWIDNLSRSVYKSFHKIEITEGFIDGVNRIQFDVWNGVNARHPTHTNPMALRVEWQAFGRLKPPDPGATASLPGRRLNDLRQTGAQSKSALPAFPRSASSFFLASIVKFSN
jgi:hypothetical protein